MLRRPGTGTGVATWGAPRLGLGRATCRGRHETVPTGRVQAPNPGGRLSRGGRPMRERVLALLRRCAVIASVQRSAISIPASDIQRDLGLTGAQLGLVMGAWYWAYALLQLPAGWLADRWGPRPTLA